MIQNTLRRWFCSGVKINHPRNETPSCGKREGRRFSNHKGEIVVFCGRKIFLRYFITLRMFILLTLENSLSVKKSCEDLPSCVKIICGKFIWTWKLPQNKRKSLLPLSFFLKKVYVKYDLIKQMACKRKTKTRNFIREQVKAYCTWCMPQNDIDKYKYKLDNFLLNQLWKVWKRTRVPASVSEANF